MLTGPEYVDRLLDRLPEVLEPDELYFHLGHFEPGDSGDLRTAQRNLDEIIVGFLPLEPHQRLLDVGCGLGGTLSSLARRGLGLHLTGVDCGLKQLERARRSLPPGIRLVHADACSLPFDDGEYDALLAIECMFHFSSRKRFFVEAARNLRAGGTLVITDFEPTDLLRRTARPPPSLDLMVRHLTPWPDPSGLEGRPAELSRLAGFEEVHGVDATENVLPSFALMVGTKGVRDPSSVADPSDRGTAALGWLLEHDFLRMRYSSFKKRPFSQLNAK